MAWFHRLEMIARLGVANDIPAFRNQVDMLYEAICIDGGFFTKKLPPLYFHKWSQYAGLALENDWKSPEVRTNDLTFRSLQILKLAGRL